MQTSKALHKGQLDNDTGLTRFKSNDLNH